MGRREKGEGGEGRGGEGRGGDTMHVFAMWVHVGLGCSDSIRS